MADGADIHTTHVLNFFYDDQDGCALTVLVNDVRFHIIVDPSDLQKSSEKPLYYEYLDKISALREAEEREEERTEEGQAKRAHDGTLNDKDSAVDFTADEENGEDDDQDSGSAGLELRNWILAAFADVTAKSAPPDREPEEATVHEWYHGPTYFYNMRIKGGQLTPELLETTDELNDRIENIVPRMQMPKYIQEIDVPWISSHNLTVQSEVGFPEPAHPGKVAHKESGEVFFFKPVDASQPDTVKREIQTLQRLEKLDLDIKAPTLQGFVMFENSKTKAMGLLLSHIDNPKPLTKLLKASVSQAKRAAWSKKSEEYIKCLHENDIIWGDAKADNFLVDEHDELWIIDFGGSYTDGWVDPELSETKEGDEQGLEKIQKALEDPAANTFDPVASESTTGVKETASTLFVTERKEEPAEGKTLEAEREKRKRDDGGSDDEDEQQKRRKSG